MMLCKCFFIIVMQMTTALAVAQIQNLKFVRLGIEEGLSNNTVSSILQDRHGFIWVGTSNGLNKYDGYEFTVYRNNAKDPNSLSSDIIRDIVEDTDGNIWIATDGGGLNMLDKSGEKFICYKHNKSDPSSIANNYINCLAFDSNGNLCVGTNGTGLDLFDRKNKSFKHFTHQENNGQSLSDNDVYKIITDSQHNLWIGTESGLNLFHAEDNSFEIFHPDKKVLQAISANTITALFEDTYKQLWVGTNGGGLYLFDIDTRTFQVFKHDPLNKNSLPYNVVLSLAEDSNKNLWIGTENSGLSILDLKTKTFYNYKRDDIDKASLSNNSLWEINKDIKGNMWIGTYSGGISLFNLDANKFTHYRHSASPGSLSNNTVFSILEDSKKNLWIATDGGGIDMMRPNSGIFNHYRHEHGNKNSISGNNVLKVYEDHEGNLWVGTWGEGITVFNLEKNTYKFYRNNPLDSNSLSSNNIWTFAEDADYNMWIGTFGGGLELYNKKHDNFIHHYHDQALPFSVSDGRIIDIMPVGNDILWIGTYSGLNRFDKKTKTFTHLKHDDGRNSISSNIINSLYLDRSENLWISTNFGLNHLDLKTNQFTNYHVENGLPGETTLGILEDDDGNLWISTNNGLSRFNPNTRKFKNFAISDGLQSAEFKQSCYKSRSGKMYFGGINGFNEFIPDSIKDNNYDPPLILTGFQIFNKPVLLHEENGMNTNIAETKEITISYKQSVISFEFASLNYTIKGKRQYAYMLKGFDKDWNYVGTNHSATYTNLYPGNYVFQVKGMDNVGNWSSKIMSVNLIIKPPYWQTWWFRILLGSLGLGCVGAFLMIRESISKKQKAVLIQQVNERTQQLAHSMQDERHARLEAEKAHVEAERARKDAEQANNAKSVFLATMSHEIRTPMNGVIGMASLLAETTQTLEQQEYTEIIRSCGENLLTVINDVLDFSKIESGKMELEYKDFDLRTCIEEVLDVFASKASKSGLDLIYEIDYNVPAQIIGDSLRLRQVIINLVSNAVKFTTSGEVFVGVHLLNVNGNKAVLGFEIRDTGIGIAEDKLHRLFKAFSQVDSSTTRQYGGTGLGLVICEKLISLMGGSISVESHLGHGTTISFTIQTTVSQQNTRTYIHHNIAGIEGKKVLVIDDNATNLSIVKNELELWKLKPVLARSGAEALTILSTIKDFDLVLTDMQMPNMDGIELARCIRKQNLDVPIILLSSIGDERAKDHTELFNSILTKPVRQSTLRKHILIELKQLDKVQVEEGSTNKKLSVDFALQYPLRILITEDNPVNIKLAERVLTKLGYTSEKAFNGQETLALLKQKFFDIILMDIQMPIMDGIEATQKIRMLKGPQPVIIAMTANAMQGDREKCLDAGMNDYISKPIKLEDLVTLLEKWALHIH